MKKTIFTGAGVAIVTPMKEDGSVNLEKLGALLDFQIDNGTDAIIICGTTGESATLTHEEHVAAIDYAIRKVNGRVPVIAGTGSNDTRYAIELSLEAQKSGADGLLLVTPYYNKTTQAGLVRHFFAVADRVSLPMLIYNVPSRTGMNVLPATYKELSKHPNIVGVKEANGNIAALAETAALCGGELALYSGEDNMIVPALSLGGKGVISVLSNVLPRETHEICSKYFEGDIEGSRRLQLDCMGLVSALFSETNPIPVKEALNRMGWDVGECRMPLAPMQPEHRAQLYAELKRHGLIS